MEATHASWGRFTARGGPAVEAKLGRLAEDLASCVRRTLAPSTYRAALLVGGYGRGEGGIELVDGEERPHNNLDLLLVTRGGSLARATAARLDVARAVAPIAREAGVPVDVGAVSEASLRREPGKVFWHDTLHGHVMLVGDEAFSEELRSLRQERPLDDDVANLVVNRGTLLVINSALLARGDLEQDERRLVVRHAMKAVIGYGDTWLHFHDAYDSSYVEKQARMRTRRDAPERFRRLYDAAMEFRFSPAYGEYVERDLAAWTRELLAELAPVHLECESLRLGRPLAGWGEHADVVLRRTLATGWLGPRRAAVKAWRFMRSPPAPTGSLAARLGFRCAGGRGRLAITFPAACYEDAPRSCRAFAQAALGARSEALDDIRLAYLGAWAGSGDIHAASVLRRLRLDVPEQTGAGVRSAT